MEESAKYDVNCPCDRFWHADGKTNCGVFCDKNKAYGKQNCLKRVLFIYYGMMVSFRVKPEDLDKFIEIIKDNGAQMIEVVG